MRKFSLHERIAVTAGILSMAAFLPSYFTLISDSPEKAHATATQEVVNEIEVALTQVATDDLVEGNGESAQFGDRLFVHYVGQLEDGDLFDTSVKRSDPFVLTLGAGQVISGWELGLEGMRVGGTRRLTVPPALGYGSSKIMAKDGSVLVPPNATLVFDVVLLKIDRPFE